MNPDKMVQEVKKFKPLFRLVMEGKRYCLKCGSELSYYYAESCIYIVRCDKCDTRTIVEAKCPGEALDKVGCEKH